RRLFRQCAGSAIEEHLCPTCTFKWPFLLAALLPASVDLPDKHLNRWLILPAGILAFEKMAEELLLKVHAIVCVILGPVFEAVEFQPFFFRRNFEITFNIATQV